MAFYDKKKPVEGIAGQGQTEPPNILNQATSPELQKLSESLVSMGRMMGELMKKVDTLGRPATILITGPPASKKSTFVGIMRHLLESSGFNTEKVKDGKISELHKPGGAGEFKGPSPDTKVVLWETTIVLPKNMREVDLYIGLQGDVNTRVSRLTQKTGSMEFAQIAGGGPLMAIKSQTRNPDIIVNTDAITLEFEQGGGVARLIHEGWRQALAGTQIPVPTDEENQFLQEKMSVLRKVGLGQYLTPHQMAFLAIRLRPDATKKLPDGRDAVLMSRINLVIGESTTSKIPVEEIGPLGKEESFYAIASRPTGQTAADANRPQTWLTTKR